MERTGEQLFFEIEFDNLESLQVAHDRCRAKGSARMPGVAAAVGKQCELIFIHGGRSVVSLRGEVAGWQDKMLELRFRPPKPRIEKLELLEPAERFVPPARRAQSEPVSALELLEPTEPLVIAPADEPVRPANAPDPMAHLRNLGAAQQLKIARNGAQRERIVLERTYGKMVWEALLSNPRITPPEVARIARKGSLPKPLVAMIAENGSWVGSPSVRRALLTNPRLSKAHLTKVLRRTPKHELKLVPKQTAYPAPVRELARKMIKS